MAQDKAYHIQLNGKGYIVQPETYLNESQRAFSARFATGDASFGDLSFWQFLTQEKWDGGAGQEDFDVVNKYLSATGFDTQGGKPRVAPSNGQLPVGPGLLDPQSDGGPVLYDDFSNGYGQWTTDGVQTFGGPQIGYAGPQLLAFPGVALTPAYSIAGYYFYGPHSTIVGVPDGFIYAPQQQAYGSWSTEWVTSRTGAPYSGTIPNPLDTNFFTWHFLLDGPSSSANGYRFRIYGPNGNSVSLVRVDSGIETLLATNVGAPTYSNDNFNGGVTSNEAKIDRAVDGTFTIKVNGVTRITFLDNTHTSSVRMELRVTNTGAYEDVSPPPWPTVLVGISTIYTPGSSQTSRALSGKLVNYEHELWYPYNTTSPDFQIIQLSTHAFFNTLPSIRQINASDLAVWSRNGSPASETGTFLAAASSNAGEAKFYRGLSVVHTLGAFSFAPTMVHPVNGNTIIFGGTLSGYNGAVGFRVVTFNPDAWTVVSDETILVDTILGKRGAVINHAATDSNGVMYFAMSDLDNFENNYQSTLYRMTPADALATKPRVSSIDALDNFTCRSIEDLNGVIYFFGFITEGNDRFDTVMNVNGEVVWQSKLAVNITNVPSAELYNVGISTTFDTVRGIIFISRNSSLDYDTAYRLNNDGSVNEIGIFPGYQFGDSSPTQPSVAIYNANVIYIGPREDEITFQTRLRGGFSAPIPDPTLKLSSFGANTPLIEKSAYAVLVELSTALPAGFPATIKLNGATVGTMSDADGTKKSIILSSEVTASRFDIELVMPKLTTYEGEIERLTVQYIPTQFKKQSWGMTARATHNLKLISGEKEQRKGETIFSDLRAAWASNTPVDFTDIDGQTYKVILTNFRARTPIIANERSRREWLVSFELLEV